MDVCRQPCKAVISNEVLWVVIHFRFGWHPISPFHWSQFLKSTTRLFPHTFWLYYDFAQQPYKSINFPAFHKLWHMTNLSCVIINFYNFPCKSSKLTKLHESKYLFVNSILLILLIEGNLGRRTNQGLASWQRQEKQKQRGLTYTYWKKSTKARKPRMQMLPAMKKKLA